VGYLGSSSRNKREDMAIITALGVSQMRRKLVPGKLYKFQYINRHESHLNDKLVMYIGEDHIHRDDGVVIENFRIQVIGEDRIRLCDDGMRGYIKDID
tara:strand:+ start:213 stop:506 length:294 start_codon:yes stop_codon:yes gene_type:complete